MSAPEPVAPPGAVADETALKKVDRWVDIVTSRLAKLTGLLVAAVLLLTTAVSKWDEVQKVFGLTEAPVPVATLPSSAAAAQAVECLTVNPAKFPERVRYSKASNAWIGSPSVEISGRNDCPPGVGIYLAITATSKMLTIEAPRLGQVTECDRASFSEPFCWDYWVPVETAKDKTWARNFPLPPARPKDDANLTDGTIQVSYQVRRMDKDGVLRGDSGGTIEVAIED